MISSRSDGEAKRPGHGPKVISGKSTEVFVDLAPSGMVETGEQACGHRIRLALREQVPHV